MPVLEVKGLCVAYGSKTIVEGVDFTLDEGQWLMIIGPNGAGKSTVISAISQTVPYKGSVTYRGRDVKGYKPHELARNIGVLAQKHYVGYSFTVSEVVRLGRYSYAPGIFQSKSDGDEDSVYRALELTGLMPLAEQSVLTLSGGELQRTFLAQLLAQDPSLLILDEPTNHLDLVYQKQIFLLVRRWLQEEQGRAVISVVHDLSLARAYGTSAILLNKGHVMACGSTEQVFTPENLNSAYSMDVFEWMNEMFSQWRQSL